MRACWLKWVGRDWSISADYIWLNYSGANSITIAMHFKNIFNASTISMNHKVGCEFKMVYQIKIRISTREHVKNVVIFVPDCV